MKTERSWLCPSYISPPVCPGKTPFVPGLLPLPYSAVDTARPWCHGEIGAIVSLAYHKEKATQCSPGCSQCSQLAFTHPPHPPASTALSKARTLWTLLSHQSGMVSTRDPWKHQGPRWGPAKAGRDSIVSGNTAITICSLMTLLKITQCKVKPSQATK